MRILGTFSKLFRHFESNSALRVPPAVTRLTVYRRLNVEESASHQSLGVENVIKSRGALGTGLTTAPVC